MRKIIFLDIDGVLNHETFYEERHKLMVEGKWDIEYPYDNFCPKSVANLNKIIETCNAEIVLSSTWRKSYDTLEPIQDLFNKAGIKGKCVGKTGTLLCEDRHYTIPRGCEIEEWLSMQGFYHINWDKKLQEKQMKESNISNYLILDDDGDMLYGQRKHFVQTFGPPRGWNGLDEQHTKKAIEILSSDVIKLNF